MLTGLQLSVLSFESRSSAELPTALEQSNIRLFMHTS